MGAFLNAKLVRSHAATGCNRLCIAERCQLAHALKMLMLLQLA